MSFRDFLCRMGIHKYGRFQKTGRCADVHITKKYGFPDVDEVHRACRNCSKVDRGFYLNANNPLPAESDAFNRDLVDGLLNAVKNKSNRVPDELINLGKNK